MVAFSLEDAHYWMTVGLSPLHHTNCGREPENGGFLAQARRGREPALLRRILLARRSEGRSRGFFKAWISGASHRDELHGVICYCFHIRFVVLCAIWTLFFAIITFLIFVFILTGLFFGLKIASLSTGNWEHKCARRQWKKPVDSENNRQNFRQRNFPLTAEKCWCLREERFVNVCKQSGYLTKNR